jgi:hypothetical protein
MLLKYLTSNSLILIFFSKNQNWWFFESEFFKELKLLVTKKTNNCTILILHPLLGSGGSLCLWVGVISLLFSIQAVFMYIRCPPNTLRNLSELCIGSQWHKLCLFSTTFNVTNDLLPSVTHAYFPLFKGFARQGVIWICKQLHQHNLPNILYSEHRFGDHSSDHPNYVHHPIKHRLIYIELMSSTTLKHG